MNPISLAGPAVEPVGLAEMTEYLRLDGGQEDELVAALIAAGRLTVEGLTRLALVTQSWRLVLDRWPADRVVTVPLAPVIAVDAIRVSGAGGVPSILEPGLYRLDRSADPVRLLVDAAAPDPGARLGGIEIDLLCGFGAKGAAVPEPLRLAVRRLVAHWFERRGDDPARGSGGPPPDVRALVAPFARPRLAR